MQETNAGIARRGFEAALRGDLELIAALLDPDVKWHGGDPTAAGTCRNRDQAIESIRQAIEGGWFAELVDVVDAGEKVVVILRPASRGAVANVTTFRGGKVVEMVHYADPADALAAV